MIIIVDTLQLFRRVAYSRVAQQHIVLTLNTAEILTKSSLCSFLRSACCQVSLSKQCPEHYLGLCLAFFPLFRCKRFNVSRNILAILPLNTVIRLNGIVLGRTDQSPALFVELVVDDPDHRFLRKFRSFPLPELHHHLEKLGIGLVRILLPNCIDNMSVRLCSHAAFLAFRSYIFNTRQKCKMSHYSEYFLKVFI